MDSALLYSEEDALRKGLPGVKNVRTSQGQVFLFCYYSQSLKLMAPHYRYRLVLTLNSKSSINNNLFAGHKVLTVNT